MSTISSILDAKIGFNYTISANVHSVEKKETKSGFELIEITIVDETGTLIASVWNQKWLLGKIKQNDKIALSGKVEFNYGFKRMTNPFIFVLSDNSNMSEIAKVVSVYKDSEKISSSWIKNIIKNAFDYLGDVDCFVPKNLSNKYRLMNYFDAVKKVHFPSSMKELQIAKRTVKYSDVLLRQVAFCQPFKGNRQLFLCEFFEDKIEKAYQAILLYNDAGFQSVIVVPNRMAYLQYTRCLGNKLLSNGINCNKIFKNSNEDQIDIAINNFKQRNLDVLICEKKYIESDFLADKQCLLIIDEMSQFDIKEINALNKHLETDQDFMYLTTEPLTKILAKMLYPNCNYTKVAYKHTHACSVTVYENSLKMGAYQDAVKHLQNESQAVVLVPNLEFVINDIKTKIFAGWNIKTVYDKTPDEEKIQILDEFSEGKVDILICACYIDFAIKPHKETVMVVENAQKMPLSYLHQLRNFLISINKDSWMNLISFTKQSLPRLKCMCNIMDGQSIMEKDIEMSLNWIGYGIFDKLGFSQLKLIDFVKDTAIIETAIKDAIEIVDADPNLKNEQNKLMSFEISRRFKK